MLRKDHVQNMCGLPYVRCFVLRTKVSLACFLILDPPISWLRFPTYSDSKPTLIPNLHLGHRACLRPVPTGGGVPVADLSSNDGCVIARNECVIARNEEVKEAGVPMGALLFKWE
jgi:hypothetical protein